MTAGLHGASCPAQQVSGPPLPRSADHDELHSHSPKHTDWPPALHAAFSTIPMLTQDAAWMHPGRGYRNGEVVITTDGIYEHRRIRLNSAHVNPHSPRGRRSNQRRRPAHERQMRQRRAHPKKLPAPWPRPHIWDGGPQQQTPCHPSARTTSLSSTALGHWHGSHRCHAVQSSPQLRPPPPR
jgi:hypothetical protein